MAAVEDGRWRMGNGRSGGTCDLSYFESDQDTNYIEKREQIFYLLLQYLIKVKYKNINEKYFMYLIFITIFAIEN